MIEYSKTFNSNLLRSYVGSITSSAGSITSSAGSIISSDSISLLNNVDSIMMKLIVETSNSISDYNNNNNNNNNIGNINMIGKIINYIDTWSNSLNQGYVLEDNNLIDYQLHNEIMNTFISLSLPRLISSHSEAVCFCSPQR